jgi:hypothetical protein
MYVVSSVVQAAAAVAVITTAAACAAVWRHRPSDSPHPCWLWGPFFSAAQHAAVKLDNEAHVLALLLGLDM